jgi:hypothetical protein
MKRYAIVHLEYGQQTRDQSLKLLARFREQWTASGCEVSLLMVDNARASGVDSYSGHGWSEIRVIAGDNSNREFTGWDAGIADLLSRGPEPDVWLFTNDTIATHHGWNTSRMRRFCKEAVFMAPYQAPWLLGEITDTAKPDMTPIGPVLQWLPTYAFVMNARLRQALGTISPDKAVLDAVLEPNFEPRHKLLREGVEPGFFQQALIWLGVDDGMQDHKELARRLGWKFVWHGAAPLTAETFPSLSGKLRCVMSECFLSVRAQQVGAVLRSPYEGQQGRQRFWSTFDFLKDKIAEKVIFKRQRIARKLKTATHWLVKLGAGILPEALANRVD